MDVQVTHTKQTYKRTHADASMTCPSVDGKYPLHC